MKRIIVILIPVIVVVAAVLLALLFNLPSSGKPAGKLMSIESYVSQNISTLSPQKEVLGGHFYVTNVQAADGKGVVHYEDGHIALVADFTYTASDQQGTDITSFTVRK